MQTYQYSGKLTEEIYEPLLQAVIVSCTQSYGQSCDKHHRPKASEPN
jgi:hypothetical protein